MGNSISYCDFMFLWFRIFKERRFMIFSLTDDYNPFSALRNTIVLRIEYFFVDEISAILNLCQGTMQNVFASFSFYAWDIFKDKHLRTYSNDFAYVLLYKMISFVKVCTDSLYRETLAWRTTSQQIKFTRFEVE